MQVFYLSHPFTGNEEKNRIETTKLMQLLGSTFPQYVFLSPIDAMKPMEHLLDYDIILSQTLELLKRCDGIILTGRWQESNGCQAEYDLAKKLCLSISFGVAGFYQQYGAEKGQKKGTGRKAWYRKDRYGSYVIVWAKTEMEAKALLDDACPGEPPGTPSRLPWADPFHSDKERAFQYEAMKHGFGYALPPARPSSPGRTYSVAEPRRYTVTGPGIVRPAPMTWRKRKNIRTRKERYDDGTGNADVDRKLPWHERERHPERPPGRRGRARLV